MAGHGRLAIERGMRLGAHSFLWTGHFSGTESHIFDSAAAAGYDGLEIAVSAPETIDWTSVARLASQYSIEVLVCASQPAGLSLAGPDPVIRTAAVKHVDTVAGRVIALGGTLLTGPMLNPVGALTGAPPSAAERVALRQSLDDLAEIAEKRQIRFAFEPLNRFQGYLLTRVDQGIDLCRATGSDRIGLLLDLFHMSIEENDPVESIRAAGDRCFHVHVSSRNRGVPGTGTADWPALRDALAAADYRGWITVEAFCFTEADAAAKAHLWHPPEMSSSDAAIASIAHLRSVFGADMSSARLSEARA